MKTVKRVVLVRHGQNTWDANVRVQDSSNFSILTKKGEAQAEASRQMLIHDLFDICFSFQEMESSGCKTCDQMSLAEALKTLGIGNKAMQSNAYADAIEWYTCAIALCENNAVYNCNRAAAYTQTGKYDEAVRDSLKAIDIDPTYAWHTVVWDLLTIHKETTVIAINKGFKKALELDPDNSAVKENLKAAEQKLMEQRRNQGFRKRLTRGSRGPGMTTATVRLSVI